jgi:hypothetical protein
MHDRPTAAELIDAARHFLEAELLPALSDPRLRFQGLVAANVLAIAGRELAGEEEALRREWALLGEGTSPAGLGELRAAVRAANVRLCECVRAGELDEPGAFRALAARLREAVVAKLQVANPRYLTGLKRGAPAGG